MPTVIGPLAVFAAVTTAVGKMSSLSFLKVATTGKATGLFPMVTKATGGVATPSSRIATAETIKELTAGTEPSMEFMGALLLLGGISPAIGDPGDILKEDRAEQEEQGGDLEKVLQAVGETEEKQEDEEETVHEVEEVVNVDIAICATDSVCLAPETRRIPTFWDFI